MDPDEYKELYESLNSISDIHRIADSTSYSHETLFVIYTQRTVRRATKDYYRVKNRSPSLVKQWKKGKTLVRLAQQMDFPPVLASFIILRESGVPRKTFWKWCREPDTCDDRRIKRELLAVLKKDKIYSPEGNEIQVERGKAGEERIRLWLEEKGLEFKTEDDLKAEGSKTPDFLLEKPIRYRGTDLKWIESKASFGDRVEVRKNMKGQLLPYRELFGPGMVIYWFGVVDDVQMEDDIIIATGSVLGNWTEEISE